MSERRAQASDVHEKGVTVAVVAPIGARTRRGVRRGSPGLAGSLWRRLESCGPLLGPPARAGAVSARCSEVSEGSKALSDSNPGRRFRVDRIDHVELFVPDRHEAAEWYRRVLGFAVVPEYESWAEDPHGPLMISSDRGTTKLALFQGSPQGSRVAVGFQLVAFCVGAAAFAEFLDGLEELELTDHRGRRVTPELVVDHAMAYSLYFSDPFGHRLELTTYEYDPTKVNLARRSDGEASG